MLNSWNMLLMCSSKSIFYAPQALLPPSFQEVCSYRGIKSTNITSNLARSELTVSGKALKEFTLIILSVQVFIMVRLKRNAQMGLYPERAEIARSTADGRGASWFHDPLEKIMLDHCYLSANHFFLRYALNRCSGILGSWEVTDVSIYYCKLDIYNINE